MMDSTNERLMKRSRLRQASCSGLRRGARLYRMGFAVRQPTTTRRCAEPRRPQAELAASPAWWTRVRALVEAAASQARFPCGAMLAGGIFVALGAVNASWYLTAARSVQAAPNRVETQIPTPGTPGLTPTVSALALSTPTPDPYAKEAVAARGALVDEKGKSSTYFHEIQARDQTISEMTAIMARDRANLATIARQLGLPESRMSGGAGQAGQGSGAASPDDLRSMGDSQPAAAATAKGVVTTHDLAALVENYLDLPCPSAAAPAVCAQALDHAREELTRGHGLNIDDPDARPSVDAVVAQPFGVTTLAIEPIVMIDGRPTHFHDGVDLAEPAGSPVTAAADGVVTFAGLLPSHALAIQIQHTNGLQTLYLHELQLLVSTGDRVKKAQLIGIVGSTGMSTGPHIHFMVLKNGTAVDPWPFIR